MIEKYELLLQRLDQITDSVKNSGNALAMLALGSCGPDRERLDQYSDLDFFVIVKDGHKKNYLDHLDWIEAVSETGYCFRNTPDGCKLLFQDGVFCEFAVFEVDELKKIPISGGLFLWKEDSFEESYYLQNKDDKPEPIKKDTDWIIGEALTNLYVGMERYRRGEKLSAYQFVQSYAVGRLLDLFSLLEKDQPAQIDAYDKYRRAERRFPNMSRELSGFLKGYDKTPEAAKSILEFLDNHFEINECIKDKIIDLL